MSPFRITGVWCNDDEADVEMVCDLCDQQTVIQCEHGGDLTLDQLHDAAHAHMYDAHRDILLNGWPEDRRPE